VIVLEGVYIDRTEKGLKSGFVKVTSPTEADIEEAVQKISRRVIRMLRQFGYKDQGFFGVMGIRERQAPAASFRRKQRGKIAL
jgi:hypothetical protein